MNKVNLHYDTIVIGGGQAGLTTGYYLKQTGRDFMILDAGARIGDSWRKRWDSLRLFTPARYNGLVGMPFPARHTTSRPRTRWQTTSKLTQNILIYRFG